MTTQSLAALMSGPPTAPGDDSPHGVVEFGLLLPANRAAALMNLARDREQSVGQILRRMIDQELTRAQSIPG